MIDVIIRPYSPEDKHSFVPLMKEFEEFIEGLDNLKRIKYTEPSAYFSVDRMIKDAEKNGKLFVAEMNGQIIGFIEGHQEEQSEETLLSAGKRKVGRINELFVKEKYRSQQIGQQLMKEVENYFKENGFESIFIGVFAPNKAARSFYAKNGYAERDIELIKVL